MSSASDLSQRLRTRVLQGGYRRVMLLGSAEQMSGPDFRRPLAASGVLVLVPGEADRALVDAVARGATADLGAFARLVEHGLEHGAQAVVVCHPGLQDALERLGLQVPLIGS